MDRPLSPAPALSIYSVSLMRRDRGLPALLRELIPVVLSPLHFLCAAVDSIELSPAPSFISALAFVVGPTHTNAPCHREAV